MSNLLYHRRRSAGAAIKTGTVELRKIGANKPPSGARSCLQLMGSANLKVDCFDDVGDGDVTCLLEIRLSARDVSLAKVRKREAVGFLYRYLEFIAGEDRVKPQVVLA